MMCKTYRDYAEKYIHVYIFPSAISYLKQVIQSVCSKEIQGSRSWVKSLTFHWKLLFTMNPPSTSPWIKCRKQKVQTPSISMFSPPPVETHHHFKAPRQSERFTILQGCLSGNLTEKKQHQGKQDIPERAPLSHITVTRFSHDLQDGTSVPSKET